MDDLLKYVAPDLIKIDVEGSEYRVLQGCSNILARGKTKFLIELHSWGDPKGQKDTDDVMTLMRSYGYHPEENISGRFLFSRKSFWERIVAKLRKNLKSALC